MKKFTLINKERSRIKVFEPFEDLSKPNISINAMMISYKRKHNWPSLS